MLRFVNSVPNTIVRQDRLDARETHGLACARPQRSSSTVAKGRRESDRSHLTIVKSEPYLQSYVFRE
jgi:hypothetical protein